MNLLTWIADLWSELRGTRQAAQNLKESFQEADEKVRAGFGLAPRGPDGRPLTLLLADGRLTALPGDVPEQNGRATETTKPTRRGRVGAK